METRLSIGRWNTAETQLYALFRCSVKLICLGAKKDKGEPVVTKEAAKVFFSALIDVLDQSDVNWSRLKSPDHIK